MPRPKVKPQDRRRSTKACLSCKFSKIRCDAQTPCLPCIRKGRSDSCVYLVPAQRVPNPAVVNPISSPAVNRELEERNLAPLNPEASNTVADDDFVDGNRNSNNAGTETLPQDKWPQSSRLTQSRMLVNSKGEKVYVGATSSLSLLQFIRQVVGKYTGPSFFTENELVNVMLEISPSQQDGSAMQWHSDETSLQRKKRLIKASLEASSGIVNVYTYDEILIYLHEASSQVPMQNATNSIVKRTDLAVLYLALAIGGQCEGPDTFDNTESAVYFAKAQWIAFEGFLCNPSVNMVRIFLLMAFYMLGACHRNAACMYLGVAARAAFTLGLHQKEQYSSCTKEDALNRLRCWRSLRILDTLVNTILGRTSSTVSVYPTINIHDIIGTTPQSTDLSLDAMYQICPIIEEVQQQLSRGTSLESSAAERLLEKLVDWTRRLPDDLRIFTVETTSPSDDHQNRNLLVGATHVACAYYFSVALITRPFLISQLMTQLQSRHTKNSRHLSKTSSTEIEGTTKLAQACIDSAVYIARTCADAVRSNMLFDNMCILKAWVFAAGLLLGFSLFVEDGSESTRAGVADAYNSSCVALHRFSRLSAQAGHYYEILNNFADAIAQYHQQLAESKRRSAGHYVYQIFTISNRRQEPNLPEYGHEPYQSLGLEEEGPVSSCPSAGQPDEFIQIPGEETPASLEDFWNEMSSDNQAFAAFF